MQSVNNSSLVATNFATRQQVARLAALTLIFSYAELMIPRVLPFFRLGLGNTALLMGLALDLTFPAFMLLSVVKAVAANLMAGTLSSPFFLVSFAQSIVSALIMFGLKRACRPGTENRSRRLLSLYGISFCGASASAVVQIALSSLYLGQGTWSLLGPMLLFNLMSGFITAWIAEILGSTGGGSIPLARTSLLATPSAGTPLRCLRSKLGYNAPDTTGSHEASRPRNIIRLVIILAAAASVFFIKNTVVLCGFLLLSFIAQKIVGKKILLLPHLSLWLFVLITSVFFPNGRVLFNVFGFSITEGALLNGLQKALRLSSVAALSQCAVSIRPGENTLLGLTLNYYKLMLDSFVNTQGSVITKLRAALSTQQSEQNQNQKEEK